MGVTYGNRCWWIRWNRSFAYPNSPFLIASSRVVPALNQVEDDHCGLAMVGSKQRLSILSSLILLSVLLTSSEGPVSSSFLKDFCSRNPSALPGLCRKFPSVENCPVVNWGEWQLEGYSPSSATSDSCRSGGKLLRFARTKTISHLSETCKSKVGAISDKEDRCESTLILACTLSRPLDTLYCVIVYCFYSLLVVSQLCYCTSYRPTNYSC